MILKGTVHQDCVSVSFFCPWYPKKNQLLLYLLYLNDCSINLFHSQNKSTHYYISTQLSVSQMSTLMQSCAQFVLAILWTSVSHLLTLNHGRASYQMFCLVPYAGTGAVICHTDTIHFDINQPVCKPSVSRCSVASLACARTVEIFDDGWQL